MIIPEQKKPENDAGYFEQLTKAIFRAGFRFEVIEKKWPEFQQAFDNFSVEKVADYDERDVERLLSNPGIVRNGRKVEATIMNARKIQTIQDEYGSFDGYLRTMDGEPYEDRSKKLTNEFDHLGRTGAYVFLFCVEEDVPAWENR